MCYLRKLAFFACLICLPWDAYSFSYEKILSKEGTLVHVLVVDPKEHSILAVKAAGEEVSRETVTALAARHGAVAAVNGGFWKENGTPSGALKIDRRWLGPPVKPRGAIGWSSTRSTVLIDRILPNPALVECPEQGEVTEPFRVTHTSFQKWNELEYIVGGAPLLVYNGEIIEDFRVEQTLESFLVKRHPRTAVGIKESGEWVFVVVDGRLQFFLGGMTIQELAELMRDLGCVSALNLDGGGSSTMVIEGAVLNEPPGKRVEMVSDAILIR